MGLLRVATILCSLKFYQFTCNPSDTAPSKKQKNLPRRRAVWRNTFLTLSSAFIADRYILRLLLWISNTKLILFYFSEYFFISWCLFLYFIQFSVIQFKKDHGIRYRKDHGVRYSGFLCEKPKEPRGQVQWFFFCDFLFFPQF